MDSKIQEEYKDIAKELRDYLRRKELSLLVGAGFSKNASNNEYKDWSELVGLMLPEIFPEKWKELKKLYSHRPSQFNQKEKSLINSLIEKHSYLGIAQKYVDKKGVHQYIDKFIEDTIPLAYKVSDKLDPSVHFSLLRLKCNTIYTFNYDDLLEHFARQTEDTDNSLAKHEALYKAVCDFKKKISNVDSTSSIDGFSYQNLNHTSEIDYIKLKASDCNFVLDTYNLAESSTPQLYDTLIKLEEATAQAKDEIKSTLNKKTYSVVKNRFELSTKSDLGQIIKLHGSLDSEHPTFDGATNTKYIITQKDYDEYSSKHSPFAKLMEITLLKDKILAVGFGGHDPNFKTWLNWVSETLNIRNDSNQKETGFSKYKVFLVDVSSNEKDKALESYYEENNIKWIRLYDIYKINNPKKLIQLFLEEIQPNLDDYIQSEPDSNSYLDNDCIKGIRDLLGSNNTTKVNWSELLADITPKISDYNKSHQISFLKDGADKMRRIDILWDHYLSPTISNDENWAWTVIHILNLSLLPLTEILEQDEISTITNIVEKASTSNPVLMAAWHRLLNRNKTGIIFNSLYTLNFKNASEQITELKLQRDNLDIIETCRLDAFRTLIFDEKVAIPSFATSNLSNKDSFLLQSVYETFIHRSINIKEDNPYTHNEDAIHYTDLLSQITRRLNTGNDKIKPYGKASDIIIGTPASTQSLIQKTRYAYALVQVLETLGITPYNINFTYIKPYDWYTCFKLLYKDDVYKVLYYTLSYDDDELITRCTQDILYNCSNIQDILENLSRAYKETDDMICEQYSHNNIEIVNKNLLTMIEVITSSKRGTVPEDFIRVLQQSIEKDLTVRKNDNLDFIINKCINIKRSIIRTFYWGTKFTESSFLEIKSTFESSRDLPYFVYIVINSELDNLNSSYWLNNYWEELFNYSKQIDQLYGFTNLVQFAEKNEYLRNILIPILHLNIQPEINFSINQIVRLSKIARYSDNISSIIQHKLSKPEVWMLDNDEEIIFHRTESIADLSIESFDNQFLNQLIEHFNTFTEKSAKNESIKNADLRYEFSRRNLNMRYADMLVIAHEIFCKDTDDAIKEKALLFLKDLDKQFYILNKRSNLVDLFYSEDDTDVSIALYYIEVITLYEIKELFNAKYIIIILTKLIQSTHAKCGRMYDILLAFIKTVKENVKAQKELPEGWTSIQSMLTAYTSELQQELLSVKNNEHDWRYSTISKVKVENTLDELIEAINL